MAFPNIKTGEPKGSDRVSTIDDRERETRTWLVQSLEEISGYPDCPFVKIGTWTSATRPINPAANVFGYNTTTKRLEYYTGSEWEALQVDATGVTVDTAVHADTADSATKATKDGDNNTISTTYLKKSGGTLTDGITISASSPVVSGKIESLTRGTNPSSDTSKSVFNIKDNDGNYLSAITKKVDASGASSTRLCDYDHQDGTQNYIYVGHTSSGQAFTYAPTPSSSSNDTNIATTAFVKNIFNQTEDYIVDEKIEPSGYIKFNSGLIINWLTVDQNTTSQYATRTISWKKPFTNAIYFYSPDRVYGNTRGTRYYLTSYLSVDNNKVTQEKAGNDDSGSYNYFSAFKIFAIGK